MLLTGAIVYLSLQDGITAKEQMYKIVEYLQKYTEIDLKDRLGMESADRDQIAYLLRQGGRAVAFFLLGILGTLSVHMTFRKMNWLTKTCITSVCLVAIAYFTEKVKEYLPTRHFSREEMLLSIAAVILGFFFVSFITFLGSVLRAIKCMMARS
ncbi:MAG: hypothetical protein J6J79_12380 [Lachnospiraceae bacterium]|nr:hypothetical protein [Lachnospiraceae bacterium]